MSTRPDPTVDTIIALVVGGALLLFKLLLG